MEENIIDKKVKRNNLYKFKRFFFKIYISFKKLIRSREGSDQRVKMPKNLDESQNIAIAISIKTILDPGSNLNYDPKSHECYIRNEVGDIYIFIENRNIKVINTVFGYDIPIPLEAEIYVTSVFKRELAKRRFKFKKAALDKVEFSLQKALDKINKEIKIKDNKRK